MKARPIGQSCGGLSTVHTVILAGAVLLVLMAAGCGKDVSSLLPQDGTEAGNGEEQTTPDALVGSWLLPGSGCDQLLVLRGGGTFTLAARMRLDGAAGLAEVGGKFTVADAPEGDALNLELTAVKAPGPEVPVYCDQWRNRAGITLDFDQTEELTGSDPGTLALRTEISDTLGRIVIGTDSARNDRFALLTTGSEKVRVYLLSEQVTDPPFFHAHFADASRWVKEPINGEEVLALPASTLYELFPEASGGQTVLRRLLNVTAAVEVRASVVAPSGLPGCNLLFFDDTIFSNPVSTVALGTSGEPYVFSLNPHDPEQVFQQRAYAGPQGDSTAYIVPIAIESPGDEGCSVLLTARPLVVSFLEGLVAKDTAPTFELPVPGPRPQRVEGTPFHPGRLLLAPLAPPLVQGAARLGPNIVSVLPLELDGDGDTPYFDILNLLQAGQDSATATLKGSEGGETLTLSGAGAAGVGLGPFQAYRRPAPSATLTPPGTVQGSLVGPAQEQAFRLSLDSAARLVLWSEGGLELQGTLQDRRGLTLAENRHGAADGQGFYLVRTLAAGSYDLVVKLLGEGGAYTVQVQDGTGIPFADDALAACAIEGGWAGGAAVVEVACRNRGVASLTGLATLSVLKRLTVGDNRITDLAPLAELTDLRELSLDGNPVADLAPLAGLAQLERLSLANTPIGAEQLPVMAGLAATLTHLDLSGAATISGQQAQQLKQPFTNLVLILPDGSVLQ